jgi:hypothetical protein
MVVHAFYDTGSSLTVGGRTRLFPLPLFWFGCASLARGRNQR